MPPKIDHFLLDTASLSIGMFMQNESIIYSDLESTEILIMYLCTFQVIFFQGGGDYPFKSICRVLHQLTQTEEPSFLCTEGNLMHLLM